MHIFSDPIPGGCNQEFSLENDPNVKLYEKDTTATGVYIVYTGR